MRTKGFSNKVLYTLVTAWVLYLVRQFVPADKELEDLVNLTVPFLVGIFAPPDEVEHPQDLAGGADPAWLEQEL